MLVRLDYSICSPIQNIFNLPNMATMNSETPAPRTSTQDPQGHPEPWELTQKIGLPLKSTFPWSYCYVASVYDACVYDVIELTNMNANV